MHEAGMIKSSPQKIIVGNVRRTVVVSRGSSAASDGGPRRIPAAPAIDNVVRNRRRVYIIGSLLTLSARV
jgi:hypothetical protein